MVLALFSCHPVASVLMILGWSCVLSRGKAQDLRPCLRCVMVLVTALVLFFSLLPSQWALLFLVCCLGCFELSRRNAKMVKMCRENKKREATKIINWEEEKKRSALHSQWSVAYNRQQWLLFYGCLRLGLSPLTSSPDDTLVWAFFLFFSCQFCDISESEHPRWSTPLFSFPFSKNAFS